MSCHWMRRALLALASAAALLVAACGSGTIESQLQPSRIVAFGDGFSDLGQAGSRYTVNDGTANVWLHEFAVRFGLTLTATAAGGTSYATGNARINTKPDAAGNSATPTVTQQVDQFLAGNAIGANDLMVINGGIADIVAEMAKVNSGAQTSDQMIATVKQAGRDLGAQVRRLVQAGGAHVMVVGTYDLGKSPWATITGQATLLSDASVQFNDQLLLSIVDLGANVLYVDAALEFNLMIASPPSFNMTDATNPVCTSVDPGPGIGTGAGQVNSALCNTSTLLAGADYTHFLFADRIYPTPQGHRTFGDFAFDRIRARF
ncbi:MAG TPA: SGNH/GDSL hydrolase family protein [Ramlibacter sp.]|nr:SGNH/GDSL hydrolase family protein [Ramlibacter sp.]